MSASDVLKNKFVQHKGVVIFLFLLTTFRLIYIYFIPITPQEAYYWYYSLHPDLSYFDHPAMVAWSIWLGTQFFGHTIFGVKILAVIWSLLTNIMLYATVLEAAWQVEPEKRKRLGLVAILFYNLTIFAHLYAIIMVPDTPLLFFWIVNIWLILRFLRSNQNKYLYLSGLVLGLGMISKYTAIAILPALFLILVLSPERRRIFLTPHPYLALMLTFLVFSVVIIWNAQHDWVSLKFQFAQRSSEMKPFQTKYLFQLIASQLFMLTPLPLIYYLKSMGKTVTGWRQMKMETRLILTGVFIISGFLFISLRSLVKMNWLLPGYLGLIVATVLIFPDLFIKPGIWKRIGIVFSAVLIIIAHLLLIIPNIPLGEGNTWSGWQEAAAKIEELENENGGKANNFIFANSYKTASLLKFYLSDQQNVYAQNIYNQPALQFDIWGVPDSLTGKNAFFVFTDRSEYKSDQEFLKSYFSDVKLVSRLDTYFLDTYKTRTIYCYYAQNYQGLQGPEAISPEQKTVTAE